MRRVSERAYERYIGNILGLNPETNDVDNPTKVNTKKLYSLLKHSKQDSSGISSLKVTGRTFTADTDKADSLNQQFQSAFSPESPSFLKALAQMTLQDLEDSGVNQPIKPSPYTKISTHGIESLLKKLNPHKASGPDQLTPIVLQTLHNELAPILQVIFQKSIGQAQLPNIWKEANVSPIFKKGDRTDPQGGTLFFPHM